MYTANGISLSSSEFEELELLVKEKRVGGSLPNFVKNRIDPKGDGVHLNRNLVQVYHSLNRKGLVFGLGADNSFIFVELNQSGVDFVDDYKRQAEAEKKETLGNRLFDLFKVAVGFGLGLLADNVMGIANAIRSLM